MIRTLAGAVPFIVATARSWAKKAGQILGDRAMLSKPYKLDKLVAAVRDADWAALEERVRVARVSSMKGRLGPGLFG